MQIRYRWPLAWMTTLVVAASVVLGPVTDAQDPVQATSQPPFPSRPSPLTPGSSSQPSPRTDPALEARLPQVVGGQPLAIESRTGLDVFPGADLLSIQPLVDGLAAQGKTLADLSIAFGHNDDYTTAITAIWVPGTDAARLIPSILNVAPADERIEQTAATIAGKAVTTVTDSTGAQQFYATGDTLWIVRANEPALTEILGALP